MSIVLNEYEWAEKAIQDRELGKRPCETLTRVAKFYLHNGYSKTETAKLLEDFIIRCDPGNSISMWANTIDRVVKMAVKHPLVIVEKIPITEAEIKKIGEIKSKQGKRLAFTLLCIAKYMNAARGTGYWVNTPDAEVMAMANINTSIKRQSMLFGQLRDAGLIGFSKKIDSLSVQVLFADGSSPEATAVTDFRNLGYQYLKLCGEAFFECQCCGITVKQNTGVGPRKKYCRSCATKVMVRQTVNSVMRHRGPSNDDGKYTVYMHLFPNGKKYIGSTKTELSCRWKNGHGYNSQPDMLAAIEYFGWGHVRHFILFENLDVNTAHTYESLLIDKYKTKSSKYGYNSRYSRYGSEFESCSIPDDIQIVEVDSHGNKLLTPINN